MTIREWAFDQRYKLYRDGRFFELTADPEEKSPRPIESLSGDAAAAARKLQAVLDQLADARPAELDRQFQESRKDQPAPQAKKKRQRP